MWGTTRTLIANAVEGVSEGYRISIKMIGVGYRGALEDAPLPPGMKPEQWVGRKRLNLKLGFSHPVLELIPEGVTVEAPLPTKFVLTGIDKQQLTQFASVIRKWRQPEPYRGKVSLRLSIYFVELGSLGGCGRRGDGKGTFELTFFPFLPLRFPSFSRESSCKFTRIYPSLDHVPTFPDPSFLFTAATKPSNARRERRSSLVVSGCWVVEVLLVDQHRTFFFRSQLSSSLLASSTTLAQRAFLPSRRSEINEERLARDLALSLFPFSLSPERKENTR